MTVQCPFCKENTILIKKEPFICPHCKNTVVPPNSADGGIPESVRRAFSSGDYIPGQRTISYSPAVTQPFSFKTAADGIVITGTKTDEVCVKIPSQLDGQPVVAIGERAFSGRSICSVEIPDSVHTIDTEAFAGCSSLTSVICGRSLMRIADAAFKNCIHLHDLRLSTTPDASITAFAGCYELGINRENVNYGNN